MLTNDLKKGHAVRLANGWYAEIADNKKGTIRMAKVYGLYTEIGSVYSHDIAWYKMAEDEKPVPRVQYQVCFGPTGVSAEGMAGMYGQI